MGVGKILWGAAAAVLVCEILEHVIFPLVWNWRVRRRPPLSGVESFVGKRAQVVQWNKTNGIVMIDGERWKAESSMCFSPGDFVRITEARSLVLTVTSLTDEPEKLSPL